MSGCEIETDVESGVEDCRSVSNSAECECISQPGTLNAKSSNLDLTSTGKPAANDSSRNTASSSQVWQSDVNPNTSTGKPVAETTKNPIGSRLTHHNLKMSRSLVGHLEKVHSNVRQKLGRQPGVDMVEIDVITIIWGIFMSATVKAAVHLGRLSGECAYHEEHGLREDQTIFQYFTETNHGSKSRTMWDIYN